jgi:RimJ/RimL family protein N-acetyltransferase
MPTRIAPMSASDAPSAAALIASVIAPLEIYTPEARAAEIARHDAEALRAMVEDDPCAVLLAYEDEAPVGFVVSNWDDGLLWLAWFGVAPSARTRGLGRALLDAMERTAPERGAHKVWCDCRTENTASHAALSRAGYRVLTRLDDHWFGQDFLLWEKRVRASEGRVPV